MDSFKIIHVSILIIFLFYNLLTSLLVTFSLYFFIVFEGIPRPLEDYENEVQAILSVPCIAAVTPAYEHESSSTIQVCVCLCIYVHLYLISLFLFSFFPLFSLTLP